MNEMNLIRLAFLGAIIIISILLVIVLLSIKKGNRKANLLLIAIVLIYSSSSLSSLLMFSGAYKNIPTLVFIAYPFVFITGPIYYFYIQYLLNKGFKFQSLHLINFIPLIYGVYKLRKLFFLSSEGKIEKLTKGWFGDWQADIFDFFKFSVPNFITIIYLVICFFAITKAIKNLKNNFSNTDIEFLTWLKSFTVVYFILTVVDVTRLGVSIRLGWDLGEGEIITNLLIAILIQYYIFQVIKNPGLVFYNLYEPKKIKQTESIKAIRTKHLVEVNTDFSKKLIIFMKKEKPYLNPELKSHELAMMLEVTPHYLSKVINKEFNVNFYSFVNEYRVAAFKEDILKKENKNLTLSAVAQNVGFNSKSSFNRIFKAITLITPREYLKQQTSHDVIG